MEKYCYFNGRIMPLRQAALPLNDIGVLRGYGVFDFLRTYGGCPFLLDQHWRRFSNSAKSLGLKIPLSKIRAEKIIKNLIRKNKLREATIRLVLTGGASDDTLHFDPRRANFFILISRVPEYSSSDYQRGVSVLASEFKRELPLVKSNNYITAVKFKNSAQARRHNELLYHYNNEVLEGATSNFFLFKKNILITPQSGVLSGITRNFVIKLAKNKFGVVERPVKLGELAGADEAFITNSTKEILPIVRIGKLKIGDGMPGPNTKLLMSMFKERVANYR